MFGFLFQLTVNQVSHSKVMKERESESGRIEHEDFFSGNASESLKMVLKGTVFALDLINKHMGSEYVSREKKSTMVNFLIFVQKNVSTIRFQEIKIRPLKGFEKMRFLCFYIIGV